MKIIVPLNCTSVSELETRLTQIDGQVDVVEIWLDRIFREFLNNPRLVFSVKRLIQTLKNKFDTKFLAVCKTPKEKGHFKGTPLEKGQILRYFLQFGGNFVDLDISQTPRKIIKQFPSENLWLSFHDFKNSHTDLLTRQYAAMKTFRPFLYKFAVTPKNKSDLEAFIQFAESFPERGIFTTMGPLGYQGREQLSRFSWGGFFALDEASKTAEGQPILKNNQDTL